MQFRFELEGGNFSKAGYASSQIKKVLKQLSVDPRIIKRVVVALYEGPGIPDIGQAMQEGFSTASAAVREMGFGAGMGLPNMKKNVDELTIESKVGEGTVVRMLTYFSANDR